MTTTTQITARPLNGAIGAELSGIDLTRPIDPDTADQIRAALAQHSVVFIREQGLDPEVHLNLGRALGEIKPPVATLRNLADRGYPEIGVLGSIDTAVAKASSNWHIDVSWSPTPLKYSILHMQVCPPVGGDTTWSSGYAAYDALSVPMQEFLAGMTAHHTTLDPEQPDRKTDHPLVIQHPTTGRRALFLNSEYIRRINELTEGESAAVLGELNSHAGCPENCVRWTWTPGDIGIWDNQFVQHYAITDYGSQRREIHRIEIQGEAPIPVRKGA
ncbi:TauD/TfdA dioxygenase family protein [Granulicoccus phenolivorans]|uniref:TauD/TfdA dioxygenase family protein n=1 Tax=Granulicoccus phenolivorans TaxID=266854 RepID=UPI000427E56E|nr:TauD/TfdA family dioxygenase [Granulicoccus phenolivorans]